MIDWMKKWLQARVANVELVVLIASIVLLILLFHFFGEILAPVLVSLMLAYLLDGFVNRLVYCKIPRSLAATIACLLFISFFIVSIVFLLPLLWEQLGNFFNEVPRLLKKGEALFFYLNAHYPEYISKQQILHMIAGFQSEFANMGKYALSFSLSTLSGTVTVIVYVVLVPLLLFFFLKDRDAIIHWASHFMPQRRRLIREVWGKVNQQIARYIRAKVLEVILVSITSGIVFFAFGLNYALLLAVLAGLSTLVPYVGVTVVSIPILLVAYLQWGFSALFGYSMIIYGVVMFIDGNLLAPLLFSEALKIHPIAVIIAILFFGSIWGFWGVFFAIPLATVVKAVMEAWLSSRRSLQLGKEL